MVCKGTKVLKCFRTKATKKRWSSGARDELVYQRDTGNGHPDSDVGYVWLDNSCTFAVQSNVNGKIYVILGVWGVWETPRTYYLDSIRVVFIQL